MMGFGFAPKVLVVFLFAIMVAVNKPLSANMNETVTHQ